MNRFRLPDTERERTGQQDPDAGRDDTPPASYRVTVQTLTGPHVLAEKCNALVAEKIKAAHPHARIQPITP